jgi:uncharacterized membrane protein
VRGRTSLAVAGLFVASGVLHLVRPEAFDELIPDAVPAPRAVNAAAGVVEIVCAYGLVSGRRWGGPASAATLLAVWPSNLSYALRATRERGATSPKALVAWARMPLQIPMIWAVLGPVDDRRRERP